MLFLLACAEQAYVRGDWEVDVVASLPEAAETLRICVEGVGVTVVGAGSGRASVPGLPADDTRVRIEVYDDLGVGLLSTGWLAIGDGDPVVWAAPSAFQATPCVASGAFAGEEAESRLLVSRFVQP
ncbi:MAG: hypothetical protein EXR71_03605 [Myxococcales bacterium]|nr:hypothetical protein [Myxococcales bacterium]